MKEEVRVRNYTQEQVIARRKLKVESTEKQWGKDYIYSKWARESFVKEVGQYLLGETILVETESYSENSMDYEIEYYSDGTFKTICYGYND